MEYTYAKKLFIVYPKFKFNWIFYVYFYLLNLATYQGDGKSSTLDLGDGGDTVYIHTCVKSHLTIF